MLQRPWIMVLLGIGMVALAAVLPVVAQEPPDLTRLPVGDGKVSTEPTVGYVWQCSGGGAGGIGGAQVKGPWFSADGLTFDFTQKYTVDGEVSWPSDFTVTIDGEQRVFRSNALPNHVTGVYPIAATDDAFTVDRNPNTIQAQDLSVALPLNPTLAETASCVRGTVALMLTGSVVFDGLDAEKRDAVAHEVQDSCQGHPEIMGQYHYHSLTSCLGDQREEATHSALMGYALDGFGLYGHHGMGGEVVTTEGLDACHGHTHEIVWGGNAVEMYHYHATYEYPYTISCFRGTPVRFEERRGRPGGPPPPGGPGGPPPTGGAQGDVPGGGK